MVMNQKKLEQLVSNLKGSILTEETVKTELKKMGFKKIPEIYFINGYKIDKKSGWITLKILQNSTRVVLSNSGKVIK